MLSCRTLCAGAHNAALSRTATALMRKGADVQADSAGIGTTLRKISTLMSRQTSTAVTETTPATIHEEEVGQQQQEQQCPAASVLYVAHYFTVRAVQACLPSCLSAAVHMQCSRAPMHAAFT